MDGAPGKWNGGWVYDPESGSTYKAEMQLNGPDVLKLRGFIGMSWFGRTETWTRESGEQKKPLRHFAGRRLPRLSPRRPGWL